MLNKTEFNVDDLRKKVPNKYAAVIAVAARAKAIRENPNDVEEQHRKLKPTLTAVKELMGDKLKSKEIEEGKTETEE